MSQLLAPNGKPSNLTPEQYKLVRTPAFKEWFGDWENLALTKINDSGIDEVSLKRLEDGVSKVVDFNGEPLVVFHGTNKQFNIFEKSKRGAFGKGFYFTQDLREAKDYGSKIMKLFLNVRKPAIPKEVQEIMLNITDFRYLEDEELSTKITELLLKNNFDGVMFQYKSGDKFVVSLFSNQIKLADGTNITFDGNNTDIRFDNGGETDFHKIEFIKDRVLINGKDFGLLEFTIKENELEIHRFYLNKQNQRLGIGRKIIGELFNQNTDVNKIIVYPLGSSIPFWLRFTENVRNDDYFEITKKSLKKGIDNYPIKNNNTNVKFDAGGKAQLDEEAQLYIDIISSNPKLEKNQKYKVVLKDKFGIDFDSIYKDQEFIDNANLNNIKNQNDFLDFDNWLKYVKIISKKRGFIPMNLYDTPTNKYKLTDEIWSETSKKLNFYIKKVPYEERGTGSGDIARVLGDTIYYTDHADFYYFLHELGHIYDFQNKLEGIIKNPAYSPTNYGTTNGGETFAENFAIYFINPMALKNWNEDVYNAMDSEINEKYKKEIYRIMGNNNDIKFDNGGDVIINPTEIECHKCHWKWKVKDGGDDLFICHKCYTDNTKFYKFEGLKGEKILGTISYSKGGRTIAQTPAPKKDRIYGSDKNKYGSSKDSSSAKQIKFSDELIATIQNKVDSHNKKYPNKEITIESAKAVVRRGMGAYSSTHRPTIKGGNPNSRVAWGLARLNAFLYKIVNGKSKSGKYSQDNDLIEELGYKVQKYEIGGVFHGTRHDFDKYSTEHIGKGEGNQFFGWGLYFTDLKDIARYYMSAGVDEEKLIKLDDKYLSEYIVEQEVKDQLIGIINTIFGEDKLTPTIELIKDYLVLEYDKENYPEFKKIVELSNKTYDLIKDKKISFSGNIYSVTLFKGKKPNEYNFLEWGEKVDNFVVKRLNEALVKKFPKNNTFGGVSSASLNQDIIYSLRSVFSKIRDNRILDNEKDISLFLLENGFNGIKFRVGELSGFEGQEGYNYLIFDADDVTIEGKEKYADGGEADEPTEFWGTEAGGVLVYCSTTERYLILLRSEWVLEPNTWGIISGKLDDDETNVEDAVLREAEEETGQRLSDLIPSFIFEKPNFKFHNFVSIIEEEFVPELNWENTNYKWVKLNEMPENLHFGLNLLLQKEDLPTLVEKNKNIKNKNQMDKNSFNTPLLIRLFELMREEVKSDVALHEIVENIMEIRSKGTLTMSDYDSIVGNVLDSEQKVINPNNQEVMFHEEHKEYMYEDIIDGKKVTVWLGKDYVPNSQEKMATGGKVESIHSQKGDVKISLDENWYSDDTDVELVPVSELIKFREFDRKKTPKYNKENSVDNINHLKFMFQKEGVKSPIIIEYSNEDKAVLIIEGNHRLNSAIDLGMEYLPARVVLKKYGKYSPSKLKNAMKVSGVKGDEYGYIPSNMKPSKVGITGTTPITFGDGGIIEGRLHSECGDDGCGRKFQVGENGHVIEAERDEAVIVADAFEDNTEYTVKGTPSEVASALNVLGGGKNFDKGAEIIKNGQTLEIPELKKQAIDTDVDDVIDPSSIIINRRSMADEKEYEVTGTPKQIASAINSIDGNGVVIERGAEIKEN